MNLSIENIKGLELFNQFISKDEEKLLLNNIYNQNNNLWDTTIKRRVQHYGIKFEYKYRKIKENTEIINFPRWIKTITKKLKTIDSLSNFNPNQCTINEYLPGIGIAPHIDTHSCFSDTIVSLSLENPIIMYLKNKTEDNNRVPNDNNRIPIILMERSLLIYP